MLFKKIIRPLTYALITLLSFQCSHKIVAKPKLTDFAYNKYSQWGEDGIIEKIFNIIGTTSKIAVEFGATDGFYFSNTARLWTTQEWKAILIEGNKSHFPALTRNTLLYDCITISAYVGVDEQSSLEAILNRYNITSQIDLLSIDIDGNDYYVFESLKTIRPRVIIIEYNPTLPATVDLYQPFDEKSTNDGFGASVAALTRIAKTKGYELVCITDTNCFFVQKELFPLFAEFETSLREIQCEKYLKHIVSTYTGKYLTIGSTKDYAYGVTTKADQKKLVGAILAPANLS